MTKLHVQGMSCSGCEAAVIEALEEVSGVEEADADHEAGIATVTGSAETQVVVQAVQNAGYEASET